MALKLACLFHECVENASGNAASPCRWDGVHVEQACGFSVWHCVAWRVEVEADAAHSYGDVIFLGDDADIGTVGDGVAEIVNVRFAERRFIDRRRKGFPFATHGNAHRSQKNCVGNSGEAEIHV